MADPRGYMTFKCQATAAASQGGLRAFGNAVGKIGDLNVLNSIGAGQIGQGLRTIASVSNTIRTGCGSLPTSIGSSVEKGANWVLEQTGISPTVVDAVRGFNPGIANQAWGQAQQIFQKAKQGHFKMSDIPSSLQDLQNLERLGRNIFTGSGGGASGVAVDCLDSPYALDLIARAPKHKFMFVVSFIFNAPYNTALGLIGNETAFVIKRSSRPGIKFQTEDVNYYNFRTKVVTKTEFEEMTMTFHDDMQNYAMRFYNAYRRAMSPIANMDAGNGLIDVENLGMDFGAALTSGSAIEKTIEANSYAASRGALAPQGKSGNGVTENVEMLKEIRLFHVYDGGRKMNVFTFLNPRMTEMTLDDLDMSSSEGSEVGIKFHYDSVYIRTGLPANTTLNNYASKEFLPGTQIGAMYPLRYNNSPGAMDAAHKMNPPFGGAGASTSCDPLGGIGTGNNPLASVGGMLSGAADSVTNAMSGLTDNLSQMGNTITGGLQSGVASLRGAASSLADQATGAANDITNSLFS